MIKFYLLVCTFIIPTYVFSQISGNVFCKQTGNPIPGVQIVLAKNGKATNLKTTTKEDGTFSMPNPSQGIYQLWVNCKGYKFYSYEIVVYRQPSKLLLSPIELEQISGSFANDRIKLLYQQVLCKN